MSQAADKQIILVVDDTPDNIDVLSGILRPDYKVKAALNGEKALKIAQTEPQPDIILLDIMMPEMDGYEVCRKVRKDTDIRKTPILVVSAAGGKEVTRRVFEAGADEHITKPFDQQDILYRINYLLDRKARLDGDGESQTDEGPEEGNPDKDAPEE